jgi:hypothetical protein
LYSPGARRSIGAGLGGADLVCADLSFRAIAIPRAELSRE